MRAQETLHNGDLLAASALHHLHDHLAHLPVTVVRDRGQPGPHDLGAEVVNLRVQEPDSLGLGSDDRLDEADQEAQVAHVEADSALLDCIL